MGSTVFYYFGKGKRSLVDTQRMDNRVELKLPYWLKKAVYKFEMHFILFKTSISFYGRLGSVSD